jgi:hypothetical protein
MRYVLVLLALLTGSCGSSSSLRDRSDESANLVPASYKADVLAFLRTYLNDPTNVKEAAIAEPVLRTLGTETRYMSCLRYNARDTLGKYSGARDRLAIYHRGRFDRLVENAREQCREATYVPFPELERLTR